MKGSIYLLHALLVFQLCAQQRTEPWQRWNVKPIQAPLVVTASAQGTSSVTVTISDVVQTITGIDCGTPSTNQFVVYLSPHREYVVQVSGTAVGFVHIDLTPFLPKQMIPFNLRGMPIKPYKLIVDGVELADNALEETFGSCGNNTKAWRLELRPDRGFRPVGSQMIEETWARDEDVTSMAPGDGVLPEIGPGQSDNTAIGAFRWAMSLGRLWNGNPVGFLRLNEIAWTTNLFNASLLSYTARSTNTAELYIATNASGSLRQLRAPQALADITTTNQDCSIKLFVLANVSSTTNGSGLFTILTNTPFVTWHIRNPDYPSGTNRLYVVEERPSVTNTSEIRLDSTNVWKLLTGNGAEKRIETRTVAVSGLNRTENIEIAYLASSNSPAYQATETYLKHPWGWELTNVISNLGATNALTNSFQFETDTNSPLYRSIITQWEPGGRWEKWIIDTNLLVPASRRLRPWKDAPITPNLATVDNSLVDALETLGTPGNLIYYYSATWLTNSGWGAIGAYGTPATITLRRERDEPNTYNGLAARLESKQLYATASAYSQTITWAEAGHFLADLPFSVWFESGKTEAYDYAQGSFSTNEIFTVTAGGSDFKSDKYVGGSDSFYGGQMPARFQSVNTVISFETDFNTLPFGIGVVPLKSTRESKVFRSGNAIFSETSLLADATGAGGSITNANFVPFERMRMMYDSLGHLTNIVVVDVVNTNVTRSIYDASWKDLNGNDSELLTWEIDENGIKTVFGYDTLKRRTTSTKVGVSTSGSFLSQADIVTSTSYDAVGRIVTNSVSGGSLSRIWKYAFDRSGRLIKGVGPDAVTTNLTYTADSKTATEDVNGRTRITTRYLDGRLKSITGNAQVAEFYDYSITDEVADGDAPNDDPPKSVTTTRLGSSISSRWTERVTGLSDNLRLERFPSFVGNNVLTNRYDYSNGLLLYKQYYSPKEGSDWDWMFEVHTHDGMGNTPYFALSPDSFDFQRMKQTETMFETDGTGWFQVTTNKQWLPDETIINVQKIRLSGFTNGFLTGESIDISFDMGTNTVKLFIDRGNKLQTNITIFSYSALKSTNLFRNGLQQSQTKAETASATKFYFDELGRPIRVADPYGFEEKTNYSPTTGWIASIQDKAGALTSFGYYSNIHTNAGLINVITNSAGKCSYFSYTSRGETNRIWGDVPYPEERGYDEYGALTNLSTFRAGTGWSGSSWPTATAGASNSTRWVYHDATGLLLKKTDAAGLSVTNTYHTNNLLRVRTLARGLTATNWYNGFNEKSAVSYLDSSITITQTLNLFGLPSSISDASGSRTLQYDGIGRLTNEVWGNMTLRKTYNSTNGLVAALSLDHPLGTWNRTFTYNSVGQLASVSATNASANYSYDSLNGLPLSTVFKRTNTIVLTSRQQWIYGSILDSISHGAGNAVISSDRYIYDDEERRKLRTREDGSTWLYDYNDRDEVTGGRRFWADWIPVAGQQYEYSYDNIGNRDWARNGGDQGGANRRFVDYDVNNLNQYTNIITPSYADIIGAAQANATNLNVNADTNVYRKGEYYWKQLALSNGSGPISLGVTNQVIYNGSPKTLTNVLYTTKATAIPSYDADGNMTNDTLWSYVWDAENRLSQMFTSASISTNDRRKLVFDYDYLNRRTRKRTFGWSGTNWASTPVADIRFVYDGRLLIGELDGVSTNILRSYTFGLDLAQSFGDAGGIGGLLMVTHHNTNSPYSTTNFFAAHDGNGNITALIASSDGSTAARYEYGPFGELIRASGVIAKANPVRFSSKYEDDDSELVYFGQRYYRPSLGRWINRDPSGEQDTRNLYAFICNGGYNSLDPDGNISLSSIGSAAKKLWAGLNIVLNIIFPRDVQDLSAPTQLEKENEKILLEAQEGETSRPTSGGGNGGGGGGNTGGGGGRPGQGTPYPPERVRPRMGTTERLATTARRRAVRLNGTGAWKYLPVVGAIAILSNDASARSFANNLGDAFINMKNGDTAMADLDIISAVIDFQSMTGEITTSYFLFSALDTIERESGK